MNCAMYLVSATSFRRAFWGLRTITAVHFDEQGTSGQQRRDGWVVQAPVGRHGVSSYMGGISKAAAANRHRAAKVSSSFVSSHFLN